MPQIRYDKINFDLLQIIDHGDLCHIMCNDDILKVQTPYQPVYRNGIPIKNHFMRNTNNICKINIEISPVFALYEFYKKIDNLVGNFVLTKKNAKYEPIIKEKKQHIQYKLPHQKIPIDSEVIENIEDEYYHQMQDKDHDTKMLLYFKMVNEKEDDKYYNYTYHFSVYNLSNTQQRQQINFTTIDEIRPYIKPGINIRFIIMPIIRMRKERSTIVYTTFLSIRCIETTDQYVKFDYNYEYIQQRLNTQLKYDIISTRYTPDRIPQLIEENELTTTHLFA